jgi:hypothetical protein
VFEQAEEPRGQGLQEFDPDLRSMAPGDCSLMWSRARYEERQQLAHVQPSVEVGDPAPAERQIIDLTLPFQARRCAR